MKYSLYTTLIALAALTVKADEEYCDGAMQDPEADTGTMSWAAFKSARLIFGNYVSLRFSLISSLSPRSSSKALECDVQTRAEPVYLPWLSILSFSLDIQRTIHGPGVEVAPYG
jgi:hypothetical protein